MPTGGSARFSSPLTVDDFVKVSSLFAVSEEGLNALGPAAVLMAKSEGLDAHASSVQRRLDEKILPYGEATAGPQDASSGAGPADEGM
jgi:histidinol dehydrogenase